MVSVVHSRPVYIQSLFKHVISPSLCIAVVYSEIVIQLDLCCLTADDCSRVLRVDTVLALSQRFDQWRRYARSTVWQVLCPVTEKIGLGVGPACDI